MNKLILLLLAFTLFGCQAQDRPKPNACGLDDCTTTQTTFVDFHEISMQEAIQFFQDKKSGVLYFGFTDCPWCQEALPILKKAATSQSVDIQYIKVRDEDRNRLYSEKQRIEIAKYISSYMEENEESILTLYVPLVIVVKDGKAVDGHLGTLTEQDAHDSTLTKEQEKTLEKIYLDLFKQAN